MRCLIVKTSSMGDVIHTLPAISEAMQHLRDIRFDWVVEENFAEIASWHHGVDNVIPIALRRWRNAKLAAWRSGEIKDFFKKIRQQQYDLVIDAQGLIKSAVISCLASGKRCGLSWQCARESLAALVYQHKIAIDKKRHAVDRIRQLFATALNYSVSASAPNYGLDKTLFAEQVVEPYVMFLHGTTWASKHWPENYWLQLAKYVNQQGLCVYLPWGNATEKQRAKRIVMHSENAKLLPRLSLREIAVLLSNCRAAVAVDTGLGHLAAALAVPTVSLYGPTRAGFTGTQGKNQKHMSAEFVCAPCFNKHCTYQQSSSEQPACFTTVPAESVWQELQEVLSC